jgi:Tol biopolymer transport system component
MNPSGRLERDLTDWLRETAMPHTPDYADEILDETARIRQRPRWTFLGRWVSLPDPRPTATVGGRRIATVVTLLLVLALILAAVSAFVGSRQALPAPFGRAGTGLLVVSQAGDIVVIDAARDVARRVVAHPDVDSDPHWSPDGTRLAFLRQSSHGVVVVIADATGHTLAVSPPFAGTDPDSLTWAPNGRLIAIAASERETQQVHLIDTATGASRQVAVDYEGFEIYWRPPDGRQLLFRTRDFPASLGLVSIEDGSVVRVPTGGTNRDSLRPMGWTPDGRAVVYQHDVGADSGQTILVDVQTGAKTRLDVTFGHVSNDGTRVAGLNSAGQFCIVTIGGGSCDPIDDAVVVDGTRGASVSWSPDDRWIVVSENPTWLVDSLGIVPPRIVADGGPGAWQRTAP